MQCRALCSEKKELLKIFGPDLIRINSLIKTAQSAVFKEPRAQRGIFFAASGAKF